MPTAAIAILSLDSAGDGMHVVAELTGTPTGGVTFEASLEPQDGFVFVPHFEPTPGVYRIVLSHPDLWYIRALDSSGESPPSPVWMAKTEESILNLVGEAVRGLIERHKTGIEMMLRKNYFPDLQIKQIVFGTALNINDFPAILVTKPRFQKKWVATGGLAEFTYMVDIYVQIFHNDAGTHLQASVRAGEALCQLINRYDSIILSDDTPLAFCGAEEGDADDIAIEEGGPYCAIFSIVWSGISLQCNPFVTGQGV